MPPAKKAPKAKGGYTPPTRPAKPGPVKFESAAAAARAVMAAVTKKHGTDAAMLLSGARRDLPVVSTGSLGLDEALGIGGLPRGRIVELYGPESSGKTTIALHTIANAQRLGLACAFIDAEHALSPTYAQALGVDWDALVFNQPMSGEEGFDVAITALESGAGIVVIDSIANMVPQAEIDGEMGDQQMGAQPRLVSKALRKFTAIAAKKMALVICINQVRQKIGVMFGDPTTTPGGKALKFYASVRLDVRAIGRIKGPGDKAIGGRTKVTVKKNKLAAPFTEAEFDLIFGSGISRAGELLDMAGESGVIELAGTAFSFDGRIIARGRGAARDALAANAELFEEVAAAVRAKRGAA